MSQILLFFQDQILGMRWLNELIGSILTSIGLNIDEKIGGMLHFFIYDSIKIFILLSVLRRYQTLHHGYQPGQLAESGRIHVPVQQDQFRPFHQ